MDPVALIRKYFEPYPKAHELLLAHSRAVAAKALSVARRVAHLNPDFSFIEEAAMLHDIGIFLTDAPGLGCHGDRPYIEHGCLGRALLEGEGFPRHALVCERHVGMGITVEDIKRGGLLLPLRDMTSQGLEEQIICYADKFYSKDGDPFREKPLAEVREMVSRYGLEKLKIFDRMHAVFGGGLTDGR